MTETQTLREKCMVSLGSDVCPACEKPKKRRQSLCLKCYRKLPRTTQQALYNAAGYEQTWEAALQTLGVAV